MRKRKWVSRMWGQAGDGGQKQSPETGKRFKVHLLEGSRKEDGRKGTQGEETSERTWHLLPLVFWLSDLSNLISGGHTDLSSSALPGPSLGASIYGSFPPGSKNPHHREILMTSRPFHPAPAFWQAQQEDLIFIDKMYPEFWPNAFPTMSMLSELRVWKQERLQTATHGN